MTYSSIFNTKPKKEDKSKFCDRICNLLDKIGFYDGNYVQRRDGMRLLNKIFLFSKLNNGYKDIDDLLTSSDINKKNLYKLKELNDDSITEDAILSNIEIIINCFYNNPYNENNLYSNVQDAKNIISVIITAIREYLLACGYKVEEDEENHKLIIVNLELSIDINNIDSKIKFDILNYYDFKNKNNKDEKKKILVNLISELEPKREEIHKKLGKHTDKLYGSFSNNFHIRHNNIEKGKDYHETIAKLSDEEICEWYDYIYSFMLNIYFNLDKLKDVKMDNSFKNDTTN